MTMRRISLIFTAILVATSMTAMAATPAQADRNCSHFDKPAHVHKCHVRR